MYLGAVQSKYCPGWKYRVPIGSQNSEPAAVDTDPDSSKATSPMRLLNQLCTADLFFHFISACTPLTQGLLEASRYL